MSLRRKIKTGIFGLLVSAFILLFAFSPKISSAQPGAQVSFQAFYDDLASYGTWFSDPQYGYVWAPRVDRNFRPYYTNGYWVNTEYGNMWMSGYPWGWAAFHYGRWAYSDMYGWVWVPGNEWGPAWVTWRQGGGYYGWAPMGPGISIRISFGSGYYVPDPYWTFVPYRSIYAHNFHRYYAPRRTRTIIRNTTIINNTYVNNRNTYVTGPRRNEVERRTGRSVRTYQVGTANNAGRTQVSGSRVSVYRPAVVRRSVKGKEADRPKIVRRVSQPVISRSTSPRVDRQSVRQRASTQQTRPVQNRPIQNNNKSVQRSTQHRAPVKQATPSSRQRVQREAQPVRSTSSKSRPVRKRNTERNVQPRSTQQRSSAPRPTSVRKTSAPRTNNRTIQRSAPSRNTSSRSALPRRAHNSHSRSSAHAVRR